MAQVSGNLVNPKQAALNNKLNPNPFSGVSLAPLSQGGNVTNNTATSKYPPLTSLAGTNSTPLSYGSQTSTPQSGLIKTPPLGSLGTTPVVKHTIAADGTQTVTHAPIDNSGGTQNPNYNLQKVNGSQPLATQTTPVISTPDNTQNQQNNSQPQNQPSQTPTYAGLISTLLGQAQDTSAVDKANADLENLRKQYATATGNIESTPIPLEFQQGREQVLGRQFAPQEAAAQSALTNALTARGQSLGSLGQAAGLAAPSLASYSQQAFNPLTGQFSGGGSLNDAVSTIADRVKNGQMSYQDATNALSGYGQGGVNALQQALGPNFNIAQSNTLAGQQGAIGPALDYARVTLNNLKKTLTNLQVPGQNSNIPLIGGIASGISSLTGYGGQQTSAKDNAIAEGRNAIQKVLASVQGGTPTDYTGQSHTLLPDNATPQQIDAAIQTLETLGTAKQNIYGNPGSATTNTNQNGANTNTNAPAGWL